MSAQVVAVHRSAAHTMSKATAPVIRLIAGVGVEGDAHAGVTVRHRSRVAKDPTQPNLRQVHLVASELHDELAAAGLEVSCGAMGENITTRGLDLLALPACTRLRLGQQATIEITGLRNPCRQLEGVRPGLQAAVLDRDDEGAIVRRAGVMAIVIVGGEVAAGDLLHVELPPLPHRRLVPV